MKKICLWQWKNVGDEIIDLGVMRRVGFAVAPSDGKSQAKAAAHFITQNQLFRYSEFSNVERIAAKYL